MILTCKNCNTNFAVPDNAIGPSGRKVRCSKCLNVWFASFGTDIYKASENKSQFQQSSPILERATIDEGQLPVLVKNNFPWWYLVANFVIISCLSLVFILVFYDKANNFALIDDFLCQKNICSSEKIVIKDVSYEILNQEDLLIKYYIVNQNNEDVNTPNIRISLYDKDETLLKSHIIKNPTLKLPPEQENLVHTIFKKAPQDTANILVEIGNKIELLWR